MGRKSVNRTEKKTVTDCTETLAFPERITVELTNRCNLRCPVCPRHHMNYPLGSMDKSLFFRILDQAAAGGTTTLVPFFRGESLLHPDCLELLRHAKRESFTLQLATNGTLLSRDSAKELVEIGLDFISFSLDTINEDEYSQLRPGAQYKDAVNAVEYLVEARKRTGSRLPEIQISAVDTGFTSEMKEQFLVNWSGLADRVRLYPQHTVSGEFGRIDTQKRDAGEHQRLPCLKPFREMVIYWDGRVAVCNHDWNREEGLGDAGSSSLAEIWNGPHYAKIRREHKMGDFEDNSLCRRCDHWRQYCSTPQTIGVIL